MTEEEARRTGLPLSTGGMMGETHRGGTARPDKTGAGGPEEDAESRAEPKDDSYTVDEEMAAATARAAALPEGVTQADLDAATPMPPLGDSRRPGPATDEVAAINARFDRIEAKLRRKLAMAAVGERLDRLERMLDGE